MEKVKVAISISRDILERVDAMVDGVRIRSRSHAIETLIKRALGLEKSVDVLILAGKRASCLTKINGKTVLERQLEWLRKEGVNRIYICAGRNEPEIRDFLREKGMKGITFVPEPEELGTAHALLLAKRFLRGTFLVVYSDILTDLNIQDLLKFHSEKSRIATIVLVTVENPARFGIAEVKGDKVERFEEKPKHAESLLINAGIIVFEPEVFKYVSRDMRSMENELLPLLASNGQVSAYVYSGLWMDVGKML